MPVRVCVICRRKFDVKSSYDNHLKRKNKCKPPYGEIIYDPQHYDILPYYPHNGQHQQQPPYGYTYFPHYEHKYEASNEKTLNNKTDVKNIPDNSDISDNLDILDNSDISDNLDILDNSDIQDEQPKSTKSIKKSKQKKPIKCSNCGHDFYKKSNLKRHMDRKVCGNINDNNTSILEKIVSEFESFKKENDKLINLLREENINLKKKLLENSSINNNEINIPEQKKENVLIVIKDYEKEEIDKIDIDKILECLKFGPKSVIRLMELIHFNPDHPENHNIYISNLKKYVNVYKNGKWNVMLDDEVIEKLYQNKRKYIDDNKNLRDKLLPSQKKSLDRWLDIDDDNDERIKNIKMELRLSLFNNRNVPLSTRKKNKKLN